MGRAVCGHLVRSCLLLAAVAAAIGGSDTAASAPRPRPCNAQPYVVQELAPNGLQLYNDYLTPERVFSGVRVLVHYEVLGIGAPPLNDDNNDGVPDYVERVARAGDDAVGYYERRGFAAILADTGGPDRRPDIYISRFAPGYLGVALPAARAEGGAFVVVSNMLDPSPERSFGSIYGTVAHELFHLIEFSYFPPSVDPPLPEWVLEGTATAMAERVYPYLDDLVDAINLRGWLLNPDRSVLTDAQGASLLWHNLDRNQPTLLDAYLARLRAPSSDDGARELVTVFERLSGSPFADKFVEFATCATADYLSKLQHAAILGNSNTVARRLQPLAIQTISLHLGRQGDWIISVTRHDRNVRPVIVYALAAERSGYPAHVRVLTGLPSRDGTVWFILPARLRNNKRFGQPTLVLVNAAPNAAASYRVRGLYATTAQTTAS